jgi:hypothetical protein
VIAGFVVVLGAVVFVVAVGALAAEVIAGLFGLGATAVLVVAVVFGVVVDVIDGFLVNAVFVAKGVFATVFAAVFIAGALVFFVAVELEIEGADTLEVTGEFGFFVEG